MGADRAVSAAAASSGPAAHSQSSGGCERDILPGHDAALVPAKIIAIFVRRWQVKVTFSEVRAHLGVETQRQWSDKAIERATLALLGLYSLITLWAGDLLRLGAVPYAAA